MSKCYYGIFTMNKKQQEDLVLIHGVGKQSNTEVKVPAIFTSAKSANSFKEVLPKENNYEVKKVCVVP